MALTKVSSSLVSDNAVTSGKIADGGIATADIADVAVTTAKIANNAILTQHIDDGQVTTDQLGADAVTAAKIADDAISEEHLDVTVITSLTEVAAATGDLLMVADVSDSNNLKKIPVSSILAGTHTGAVNTSGTITTTGLTINASGGRQYINTGHLRLSNDYKLEWGGGTNFITGNNSTGAMSLTATANLILDATADIKLDADSSNIYLADGGTDIGLLSTNNQDLNIRNLISDKDIYFQGKDGSSTFTALTLDMSEAGAATFNSAISSGAITANTTGAAQNALDIGGSQATNYTIQRWLTSAHSGNEAYIIAYGASHASEAGNFAIKNLEASKDIFFELAGSVKPLRLTSTGATFAGSVTATGNYTSGNDASIFTFQRAGGAVAGNIEYNDATTDMEFGTTTSHAFSLKTGNTRRLSIDNSGNFMVGNTTAVPASGFDNQKGLGYTDSSGKVEIATTANAEALVIGKNNSNDGDIIVFRKQSNTFGNIAIAGTNDIMMYSTATNHTGLRLGEGYYIPVNNSGAATDNLVDLGLPSIRYKDLHLSGTANVGAITSSGNITMTAAADRRIFMGGQAGATFGLAYDSGNPNYGIFYTEASPDVVNISPNGSATDGSLRVLGNGQIEATGGNIYLTGSVDRRIKLSDSGVAGLSDSDNTVHIRANDDDLILSAAGNGTIRFKENGGEHLSINKDGYAKFTSVRSEYAMELNSAGGRAGIVLNKPGTSSIMGSLLMLASDESYRLGTASNYHVRMMQNGDTYFGNSESSHFTSNGGLRLTNANGYNQLRLESNATDNTNKTSGITSLMYTNNTCSIFQGFFQNGSNAVYYGSADGAHRGLQRHYFYVNDNYNATSNHKLVMTLASSSTTALVVNGNNSTGGTVNWVADSNKGSNESHCHYGSNGDWYIRPANVASGDVNVRNYAAESDERLKTNIVDITYGTTELLQLRPRKFEWKEGTGERNGFIAQEVESVIPAFVKTGELKIEGYEEEDGIKTVDYNSIVATLVKTVQELEARIKTLEG